MKRKRSTPPGQGKEKKRCRDGELGEVNKRGTVKRGQGKALIATLRNAGGT